jgi:chemotaxis protein methyltransferase CheR
MGSDLKLLGNFRKLIYEKLGINISKEKIYFLETKLKRLLNKENIDNLQDFYDSLISGSQKSMDLLIKYITTNHTFFFRENDHLDILCDILQKRKSIQKIYIWCAAASTGEEVYSIIIKLLENGIYNFAVFASDINKKVLHHLNKGIYHNARLSYVDKNIMQKYFQKIDNEHYKISGKLRKFILIKSINLIDRLVFDEKFDFIFCRNVLIYFDEQIRKIVVENLIRNLKKGGYLFIGQSETLFIYFKNIKRVHNSVYIKTEE